MRRVLKISGIIVGVLVIGVIIDVVYVLVTLNAFRTITPHFSGSCIKIPGVMGGEDISVDHQGNVAYVSAADRHARDTGVSHAATPDGIYRLSLEAASEGESKLQYLPLQGLDDFHPHGIDIHRLADGGMRLFVVNHNKSDHSVEILQIEDDHLVHLQTVRDALIISPNDVVALGPQSFYVTNDRAKPRILGAWQQIKEIFLPKNPTTVVFWDGQAMGIAATGIKGANGITMSADGAQVYVSGSHGNNLLIFDRDEKNRLTLNESIELGSSPDNVLIGPDGNLLIAGHPSIFQLLMARTKKPWDPIPSQVIAFSPAAEGKNRLNEIYMNRGEEISNVTVAAPYGAGMFLMGNAYDEGILICRQAKP